MTIRVREDFYAFLLFFVFQRFIHSFVFINRYGSSFPSATLMPIFR